MVDFDLDLDTGVFAPQIKKVKINGKIIEVHPPRVNDIPKFQSLKGSEEDVEKMLDVIQGIIPQIREANPTIKQLEGIIELIMGTAGIKKNIAPSNTPLA